MNGTKRRAALGILLALQGIGAIGGAIFVVPNLSVDNLKTTLFPDYTIPAVGLGVMVGGGSLQALALLLIRARNAAIAAAGAGLAVMVFEIVEVTAMKGSVFTDPAQIPLWQQPLWFLIGAVIVVFALGMCSPSNLPPRRGGRGGGLPQAVAMAGSATGLEASTAAASEYMTTFRAPV